MQISVYITSYNQKDYLVEAIESVLAQTLRPQQVIIVDDASSDGSQELITGYAKRYPGWITPVLHPLNQGVVSSRNDALQAVTGEYVTCVDGDDRFLPNKLEIEANRMQSAPDARLVYSNYAAIDESGQRIGTWAKARQPEGNLFERVFGRQFPKQRLFRSELVHFPSWQATGFYDPKLPVYEDYDMRIRLTHQLRAAYTGEVLSEYRIQQSGLSKLNGQIYLDAFEYIRQKNAALLAGLPAEQRAQLNIQLDQWKASLLRKIGRQHISGAANQPRNRQKALQYYQKSLKYHRMIDTFFWLEFILGSQGYTALKRLLQRAGSSRAAQLDRERVQ